MTEKEILCNLVDFESQVDELLQFWSSKQGRPDFVKYYDKVAGLKKSMYDYIKLQHQAIIFYQNEMKKSDSVKVEQCPYLYECGMASSNRVRDYNFKRGK
jgi:hypothetical protein